MADKTLGLLTTVLRVIIAILGVVFIVVMIGGTEYYPETDDPFFTATGDFGYGGASWITYISIALCAGAWILFAMSDLVVNFKDRKKVLVSFGVFMVLLVIGYVMASGHVFSSWAEKGVTESTSKWVGAGLMSFYVLVTCAILSIVWSEVSRLMK